MPWGGPGVIGIRVEEGASISRRQWFHLFVGTLVTVACLYWAVKDIDWTEVGQGFAQARYESIPLYLLFLGLFFWLKAIRWSWLLLPVKVITPRQVAGPMMAGFMGNNILPAHLGEFIRVVLLGRQERISMAGVLTSVAIERLLDVFAVLLLVGIGLVCVRDIPDNLRQAFLGVGLIALVGVLVLVAGLIWLRQAVAWGRAVVARLPISVARQAQLSELIESAATGTTALKQGHLLLKLLVNSLVQWGCNCVMIYISLRSFGIAVPFAATLILLGVLVFAVTIPSTPGFFGAIQLAFVKTLAVFGVVEATAFAASIYYHLLQYVVVTAVGIWCVWRAGATVTGLQHDAELLENPPESAG